jgi:hypothetical protein
LRYVAVSAPPPALRWYGPTLAEQQAASLASMPSTIVMGAAPAPMTGEPYMLSFSQTYPVRTPLLAPRSLGPAGTSR